MSLTIGTAPFGQGAGGLFNFRREGPDSVLYLEDSPRRVRGVFAGETIVDSVRVKLLHETERLPVWYFPEQDVRTDHLEPSERATHCPFKGDARYWSLRVGDRTADDAAWAYPEPLEGAPSLDGHIAFYWKAMDAWFEEDEEVFVHPRDPYHRLDALHTSRHVRVSLDGELLAESIRSVVLFETGLPPRYYLPPEDVRTELLTASDTHSRCPYKGLASYYSTKVGDGVGEDLFWYYPQPRREVEKIAGRIAFYNERVDLEVDGVAQPRPQTRFA